MRQANRTRPDRNVHRRLQAASLGALLVTGTMTSEAQSPVKQVLLLQSLDRGSLILDQFKYNGYYRETGAHTATKAFARINPFART